MRRTADVAAHQFADLFRRLRLAFGNQSGGRANLARRAVAALECVVINEGLLQWMQRPVFRQPFNRGDARTVDHDCKRQAGNNAPAINQHRAGAALTLVTALFRAGQVKMLAQHIEQCRPRIERERMLRPVHGDIHGNRARCAVVRPWLSGSTGGQAHGNRHHRTAGENVPACRMARICSRIGFVLHEGSDRMGWKLERGVSDRPFGYPGAYETLFAIFGSDSLG